MIRYYGTYKVVLWDVGAAPRFLGLVSDSEHILARAGRMAGLELDHVKAANNALVCVTQYRPLTGPPYNKQASDEYQVVIMGPAVCLTLLKLRDL